MHQKLLSELIEQRVNLGRASAKGFRAVKCEVCHDYQERGGFKFDTGVTGYNDFNCGAKFVYEEGSGKLSKEAKRILIAFGITEQELNEVIGSSFFNKAEASKEITAESLKPVLKLFTPPISLPPDSYLLGADHHEALQEPLIEYLLNRCLDPLKLNAYFSLDPKFLNRVIIPCTRDDKIIYWQARTILDIKPRYLSPGTNKDAVLWGYDNFWLDQSKPLFITEGIFDAAPLDGVALLGSILNQPKIEVLSRCRRRKIFVVDRDQNGARLADIALKQGSEVTFAPIGTKDVNDSIQKHGRLFTIWALLQNATVPSSYVANDGVSVQSKLALDMQLALTRIGK